MMERAGMLNRLLLQSFMHVHPSCAQSFRLKMMERAGMLNRLLLLLFMHVHPSCAQSFRLKIRKRAGILRVYIAKSDFAFRVVHHRTLADTMAYSCC
jgi:hypothetical protein